MGRRPVRGHNPEDDVGVALARPSVSAASACLLWAGGDALRRPKMRETLLVPYRKAPC